MGQDELLEVFSILYGRAAEDGYRQVTAADRWSDLLTACGTVAGSPVDDALATPPSPAHYRSFCNAILTPGIPGSVLPVESLYKPWSTIVDGGIGSNTGYYLGDHALHIIALCENLQIGIPERFSATPDHLSLLLELLAFLEENARPADVRGFITDHLDWLGIYADALDQRAAVEDDAALAASIRFFTQLTGLLAMVIEGKMREGDEIGNE